MFYRLFRKAGRFLSVAALALALCLFPAGSPAFAASGGQSMEKLSVELRPAPNGDVAVKQVWRVRLEDRGRPYRNLYFSYSLPQGGESSEMVSEPAVYDNDRGVAYAYAGDVDPESVSGDELEGQCYRHVSGGTVELGWFMPALDEGTRTFTLTYTLRNLMQIYSDTAELYLYLLPQKFGLPVEDLSGSVLLPKGGKLGENLWAWLHTDVRDSGIQSGTVDRVDFSARGIPAETSVELRVCAPVSLFPLSEKKSSEAALARIQAEEQRDADRAAAAANREFWLGVLDAVGAGLLLVVAVILFVWARRKNRRLKIDAPEYTRDIPPGNSPAGVANLYYYYDGVGEKQKNRMFSATFLSLAHKGYVRFREENKDFAAELTESAAGAPLTKSETVFYKLISEAAGEFQGAFTMKQLRQYAEKHPHSVSREMDDFLSASRREIAGRGYFRDKPASYGVLKAAGIVLIAAAFALFFGTGAGKALLVYLPLSMIVSGFLLILAGSVKMKLSEKGEQDLGLWNGLKKYMLEFSRMKEYGVPQLALWEEYLVYATMMGVSKEVCAQLKLVYPQLSEGTGVGFDPSAGFLYYMFWPRAYGGGFFGGRGFGESLGVSLGDIGRAATRLANPPANGNGGFGRGGFGGGGFGGGGFSGGGGGFGGGGGGGVR